MVRIFYLWLCFVFVTNSWASSPFSLPNAPSMESSPPSSSQSQEIRNMAKQLENPEEREKLVKSLQALAAAQESLQVLTAVQEVKEQKKEETLVSYCTPAIQFVTDGTVALFDVLAKLPFLMGDLITFLKAEKSKKSFWNALMWLPLLIVLSGVLEATFIWCFKQRLGRIKEFAKVQELANNKSAYAFITLFLPLVCPLFILPLVVSNQVGNWIVGFWLFLFIIRIFLLKRRPLPVVSIPVDKAVMRKNPLLLILAGAALWGLLAMGMIKVFLGLKSDGEDFILNLLLLMCYPLLVFYFQEWRVKTMSGYLKDSAHLSTTPHKIAPFLNLVIRYLPWFLVCIAVPVIIDKVFMGGSLWKIYGLESIGSLVLLVVFLIGRRRIETLAHYKIPKIQAFKIQAFITYVAPLQVSLVKGIQWVWHFLFFLALMIIWNYCFSDLFISAFSHPIMRTVMTTAIIWGIVYLLWIGLDFFAQFHTKPQNIKGKKREPTVFAKTFGPMLHSVARWVMVLVSIFITLEFFGFNLKALVYIMSAFALAISLGAQSLVKDIINGFFSLIDGNFAVGETVTIGAHTGIVESLSLRAITLRHSTGFLQTIPFSEVGNIINKSRDYNILFFDVSVSYKTKIGSVHEALMRTEQEVKEDPVLGKMVLEPLKISGIDQFTDTAVHMRATLKITPDPTNYFARQFNQKLKAHMDALKIIPPISFQEAWSEEEG